jgi:hypothetical protein
MCAYKQRNSPCILEPVPLEYLEMLHH